MEEYLLIRTSGYTVWLKDQPAHPNHAELQACGLRIQQQTPAR